MKLGPILLKTWQNVWTYLVVGPGRESKLSCIYCSLLTFLLKLTLFCSETLHLALTSMRMTPACPYLAEVWRGVSPYWNVTGITTFTRSHSNPHSHCFSGRACSRAAAELCRTHCVRSDSRDEEEQILPGFLCRNWPSPYTELTQFDWTPSRRPHAEPCCRAENTIITITPDSCQPVRGGRQM